jgi:hypothetical protein
VAFRAGSQEAISAIASKVTITGKKSPGKSFTG